VSTVPPLPMSRTSLRLVGIWAGSLVITIVALVGGAFLAPFLPEDDIVHCVKCLVILGLLPFAITCLLSFRVLWRSALFASARARGVMLAGYSTVFAVAATFADLILVGSLLQWIFPT